MHICKYNFVKSSPLLLSDCSFGLPVVTVTLQYFIFLPAVPTFGNDGFGEAQQQMNRPLT